MPWLLPPWANISLEWKLVTLGHKGSHIELWLLSAYKRHIVLRPKGPRGWPLWLLSRHGEQHPIGGKPNTALCCLWKEFPFLCWAEQYFHQFDFLSKHNTQWPDSVICSTQKILIPEGLQRGKTLYTEWKWHLRERYNICSSCISPESKNPVISINIEKPRFIQSPNTRPKKSLSFTPYQWHI